MSCTFDDHQLEVLFFELVSFVVADRRFDLLETLVALGHPQRWRENWEAVEAVAEELDVHMHWEFPGTFRLVRPAEDLSIIPGDVSRANFDPLQDVW